MPMFLRYLSTKANADQLARTWLSQLRPDRQLLRYFDVSYTHSSGKGGQHVNTSDSKAQIRMNSSSWYHSRNSWMDPTVFDQVMSNYRDSTTPQSKRFSYFTASGDVLVESQRTRYRDRNLEDCLEKFVDELQRCGMPKEETGAEKKLRWKKLKKRDNERRLEGKRRRKDKKEFRKVKVDNTF